MSSQDSLLRSTKQLSRVISTAIGRVVSFEFFSRLSGVQFFSNLWDSSHIFLLHSLSTILSLPFLLKLIWQ